MRRSEMVQNLARHLMSRLDWSKEDRLVFASELLSDLEIDGMLPPPKSLYNINENILYYYTTDGVHYSGKLEDVGTVTDVSILWEPEKEEDET